MNRFLFNTFLLIIFIPLNTAAQLPDSKTFLQNLKNPNLKMHEKIGLPFADANSIIQNDNPQESIISHINRINRHYRTTPEFTEIEAMLINIFQEIIQYSDAVDLWSYLLNKQPQQAEPTQVAVPKEEPQATEISDNEQDDLIALTSSESFSEPDDSSNQIINTVAQLELEEEYARLLYELEMLEELEKEQLLTTLQHPTPKIQEKPKAHPKVQPKIVDQTFAQSPIFVPTAHAKIRHTELQATQLERAAKVTKALHSQLQR